MSAPTDPPVYGTVFHEIDRRLRERYRISIKDHVGDTVVPEQAVPLVGRLELQSKSQQLLRMRQPEVTVPGRVKKGFFIEGKTILQGITFPPKDFPLLLEIFRSASNSKGQNAFHYHPLKPAPGGGIISNILNKAEQIAHGDLLGLSYDQTKVGLTKATEERSWGFREIADTYNTEVSPVQMATKVYSGQNKHTIKFGQTPGAYARQVDITSLHVALTPAACNIHIDDVGFVMRGPKSVVGMTPDFIQHIVNELLWKSFLRDWLISKYGNSAFLVSAVEHLSLMLPSSDTRYALMGGLKLDLGTAQFTAAFTWGCKAVDSERLTIDERIVPIPDGWSLGVGFQKRF